MPGVVDADTHVLEHEAMWQDFDEGGPMCQYRPLLVSLPTDTSWGVRNAFWLIEGEMYPKSAGRLMFPAHTPTNATAEMARTDIHLGARRMEDVPARLQDMDKRGVDVQLVFPTLFIFLGVELPELEAAICHAYNKFMGPACKRSEGRLGFVATLPFHSVDASIAEMNYAKEQGAAGLFFRPIEVGRSLGDSYFHPIYDEANRLRLPVCIHTGGARFTSAGPTAARGGAADAFTSLVTARVPERYADLKFGFMEFGSMWLPETIHRLSRRTKLTYEGPTVGDATRAVRADPGLLKDYRIYVTCFADDDLPFVLTYSGEGNILVASDYAHQDATQEVHMIEDMRAREDLDGGVVEKILCDNPRDFLRL